MAPERTILDGGTVVTMDGARTEHATGHVVIENGRIAAVGAGRAGGAGRPAHRRHRLPRHPGAGEHAPPPLPVGDPGAGRRRGPVRLAHHAVPGLGRHRRGHRRRRRGGRAGLAGPHRVHHLHRPPLRLPGRRRGRARRRDLCGPTGRPAVHAHAGLDGPRPARRRFAAGPRGRGHRHHPGRECRGDRHPPRPGPGLDAADRAGALLAVLGDRGPAAAVRRTGAGQGRAPAHPPGGDHGRGAVLPGAIRPHPGRVHGDAGLAGRRRLAGPRHPLRRSGHRDAGRRRDRRRALPVVQRPPRRRHRTHRRPARGRGPGRPRRRRRGQQRGLLTDRGGPPRPAVRPRPRRPAGADCARRVGVGHDRRRPAARLGRPDRLPRAGQASRHRCVADRRSRRTPMSWTRSPPLCWAPPRRSSCSWSAAERWSSETTWSPSTNTNSPNPRSARTAHCWPARVPSPARKERRHDDTQGYGQRRAAPGRRYRAVRHRTRLAARPGVHSAPRRAARRASAVPAR